MGLRTGLCVAVSILFQIKSIVHIGLVRNTRLSSYHSNISQSLAANVDKVFFPILNIFQICLGHVRGYSEMVSLKIWYLFAVLIYIQRQSSYISYDEYVHTVQFIDQWPITKYFLTLDNSFSLGSLSLSQLSSAVRAELNHLKSKWKLS